jgi:LacI family transcriptional regulator
MKHIPKVALFIKAEGSYGRRLLLGIAKYAHIHGPWSFFHEVEEKRRDPHFIKDWRPDGIISDGREASRLRAIFGAAVPIIVISTQKNISEGHGILTDWDSIGQMAARHFLDRGFRHFGFCGYDDLHWSKMRAAAFSKYIAQSGYQTDSYNRKYVGQKLSWEKETTRIGGWLKRLPKPCAVMACNDDCARDVLTICKTFNIHVPEEVAIIGVDDDEIICNLAEPPLSSVHLNTEKAGYEAAELLGRLMDGEKLAGEKIIARPTHVEVRQSSDILAIKDHDIVTALHYIRSNIKEQITVNDVIAAVGMSDRHLYNKFKRHLGRSVSQEIRNVKTQHIARMLIETNLSIVRIAAKLNYSGVEKLSRYFAREMGISPMAFRKQHDSK